MIPLCVVSKLIMQVKRLVYRAVGSKNVTVPLIAYNNERATVAIVQRAIKSFTSSQKIAPISWINPYCTCTRRFNVNDLYLKIDQKVVRTWPDRLLLPCTSIGYINSMFIVPWMKHYNLQEACFWQIYNCFFTLCYPTMFTLITSVTGMTVRN